MAPPANIRFNTLVPFPALVKGSGPITLAKQAGTWIIGFTASVFGIQFPAVNYANDYALVWDAIAKSFILVPLSALAAGARPQRAINGAGNLPITASDSILNIVIAAPLTITVPPSASRAGAPLTFKNSAFSTAVATLAATVPEGFDGQADLTLAPGQSTTILPVNDGVNNALHYEIV
jgi:hypothetical protein